MYYSITRAMKKAVYYSAMGEAEQDLTIRSTTRVLYR